MLKYTLIFIAILILVLYSAGVLFAEYSFTVHIPEQTVQVWVDGYWKTIAEGYYEIDIPDEYEDYYYDIISEYWVGGIWVSCIIFIHDGAIEVVCDVIWHDPVEEWIPGQYIPVVIPAHDEVCIVEGDDVDSPEVLLVLTNKILEGSDLEITLSNILNIPGELCDDSLDADNSAVSVNDYEAALRQLVENTLTETNIKTQEKNPDGTGDPVRLPTGVFLWNDTDIAYSYLNSDIEIQRNYISNNQISHSFGKGWIFNFDTRIILGLKPKTGEEVAFLAEHLDEVTNIYEEALQKYNDSIESISEVLRTGRDIQNIINCTVQALEDALDEDLPYEVISRLRSDLDNANAKKIIADDFVLRAETAESNLLASYST